MGGSKRQAAAGGATAAARGAPAACALKACVRPGMVDVQQRVNHLLLHGGTCCAECVLAPAQRHTAGISEHFTGAVIGFLQILVFRHDQVPGRLLMQDACNR